MQRIFCPVSAVVQRNLYNETVEVLLKHIHLLFTWHSLYKIIFIYTLTDDERPPLLKDRKIYWSLYTGFIVFIELVFCLLPLSSLAWGPGSIIIWEGISVEFINQMVTFLNALRPRRNEQHFSDDIFKRIFFNENARISIKISLKFVPDGLINNIPALVQIMAWHRPGDKPLSEPMMVSLRTHIRVTRPQWVDQLWYFST